MKEIKPDMHLLIKKYFEIYLPVYTKKSPNTILNYKKSLNSFRKYLKAKKNVSFTNLSFDCFSKDMVYEYLIHLQDEKHNSAETLNLRLAAIRAFIAFCSDEHIELVALYASLKKIKRFKGPEKFKVDYLTEHQLKAIFNAPDIASQKGRRDRFFMILAYETGGRVQEILDLRLHDFSASTNGEFTIVRIHGKGDKTRSVPLVPETVDHLNAYMKEFHSERIPDDYLFYTIHNDKKTQMKVGTVDSFLKKYALKVNREDPSFPKTLHCHMFRHSIAMAMYKKGIPMSYIKDFLGHSSLESTKIYSYADDETIANALKKVNHEASSDDKGKKWKNREEELLKYCGLEK